MSGRALIPYEYNIAKARNRLQIGMYNKKYTPYIEHGSLTGLGTLTIQTYSTVDNNTVYVTAKNTGSTLKFELVSLYIETKRTVGSITVTSEWTHDNWITEAPTYNFISSTITSSNQTVFNFMCADQSHWLGKVHVVFRISYGASPNIRYTYYNIWWD